MGVVCENRREASLISPFMLWRDCLVFGSKLLIGCCKILNNIKLNRVFEGLIEG